jgi:hypothetical protein
MKFRFQTFVYSKFPSQIQNDVDKHNVILRILKIPYFDITLLRAEFCGSHSAPTKLLLSTHPTVAFLSTTR